ncbi:MAG: rod shape-determining protein MreC [Paludibacteraceae bacterium]
MQALLKFILRYGNFLLFILLEVAAFLLVVWSNAYPRSSALSTANRLVAWQYEMVSEVTGYFGLKGVNERLAAENAALRSTLENSGQGEESDADSTKILSTNYKSPFAGSPKNLDFWGALKGDLEGPRIIYREGKVVQMTMNGMRNYLTINRGEEDDVYEGMGVRNDEGAVGIVATVGKHYSVVLPLINIETRLSCRFLKNDYIGTLQWDGRDTRFADLADVATHLEVNVGDTIVTSGLSTSFPAGVPVGVVEECRLEEGASYYTVRVRLATDFRRLRHIEVIDNEDVEEINGLRIKDAG